MADGAGDGAGGAEQGVGAEAGFLRGAVEGDESLVERGLILVKGSVPGTEGSFVKVRDAIKSAPKDVPTPGAFRKAGEEAAAPAAEEEAPVVEAAAEAPVVRKALDALRNGKPAREAELTDDERWLLDAQLAPAVAPRPKRSVTRRLMRGARLGAPNAQGDTVGPRRRATHHTRRPTARVGRHAPWSCGRPLQ